METPRRKLKTILRDSLSSLVPKEGTGREHQLADSEVGEPLL